MIVYLLAGFILAAFALLWFLPERDPNPERDDDEL
jgi:hypothetical protein